MADRRDALLKEYEVCQQDINAWSSRAWTSTSIVLSTCLLGIVYLAQWSSDKHHLKSLIVIVAVAIGAIVTLRLWKRMLRRDRVHQKIVYIRMRQIERELGLRKNIYIDQLDGLFERDINDVARERMLAGLHPDLQEVLADPESAKVLRARWRIRDLMLGPANVAIGGWVALSLLELISYFDFTWERAFHLYHQYVQIYAHFVLEHQDFLQCMGQCLP